MKIETEIENLRPKIGAMVKNRLEEFEAIRKESNERIFQELAFCILTANSSARMGMKAQSAIGSGFITYPVEKLMEELHSIGYRFWRVRARYIVEARWIIPKLRDILAMNEQDARMYLVRNVKGLGMKEASHFLRNTGARDLAILDRHILRILNENGIIEMPKSLTLRRYVSIENEERKLAGRVHMTLAELDLYLWYMKTGEILK